MKELEDERRLDERREICLKATFVEFAMMRSSTMVLKSGCEQMPMLASLEKRANAFSLTSTSLGRQESCIPMFGRF